MRVTDLSITDISRIRKTFCLFDPNKTGKLKNTEFGLALRWLKLIPTDKEIEFFLQNFHGQRRGYLTLEEFTMAAAHFWIPNRLEFEHELWQAFLVFDKDSTGYLTGQQLEQILTVFGLEPIPTREVDKIMTKFGDKKTNRIEYGYLIRAWQK